MSTAIGRLSAILELNSSQFSAGIDRAQKRLDRFRRKANRAAKGFAKDTARLGAVAAVAGTGIAIKQFADFEAQLIAVGKVTGTEGKKLEQLGKKVQKLARKDVPVATVQLLEVAEAAGRLGVEGEENILAFTETVGKLGLASDLSGDMAATSLARLLNVTGEAMSEVGTLGSVIVRLGNNFAASESEIAHMASRVAQATAQFEVSSSGAAALGTAMKAMGIRAEAGGTIIGKAMRAINDALVNGGKEMDKLSEITGMTGEKFEQVFRRDAVEAFNIFIQGMNKIPAKRLSAELAEMGLTGDRVNAVLPSMAANARQVQRAMDLTNDELSNTQALNVEAAKAAESFKSQMRFLGNALSEVGVAVGRALVPKIVELGNEIRDFITEAQKTGQLKAVIEDIAAAFNATVTVVRTVFNWISVYVDRIRVVKRSIKELLGLLEVGSIGRLNEKLDGLVGKQKILEGQLRRLTEGDFVDRWGQRLFKSEEQVRQELEKVNEEIKSTTNLILGLQRTSSKATETNEELAKTTKMLGDNSAIAAKSIKEMGEETKDAGEEAKKSTVDYLALNRAFSPDTAREAAIAQNDLADQINRARKEADKGKDDVERFRVSLDDLAEAGRNTFASRFSSGFAGAFRDEFINEREAKRRAKDLYQGRLEELEESLKQGTISKSEALEKRKELYDEYRKDIEEIDKSIGDRLKTTLVDSLADAIDEMIQTWVKSGIMGLLSGEGLKGFSISGLFGGGGDSGGGLLSSIGTSIGLGKLFGPSAGALEVAANAGIGGASVVGTAPIATGAGGGFAAIGTSIKAGFTNLGTSIKGMFAGGGGAAGLGAVGTLAAPVAAVLAGRELMKLTGLKGTSDPSKARAAFRGFEGTGPMGAQVGVGKGFSFAGGPNAGFAREFAAGRGVNAFEADVTSGLQAFKGVDGQQLIALLDQAQQQFEELKAIGTDVFSDVGADAAKMGNILRDGLVKQAELAELGIEGIGIATTHAETGVTSLAEITSEQFGTITRAINTGQIRMEALRGETEFSQREMEILGEIGVDTARDIGRGFQDAASQSGNSLRSLRDEGVGSFNDIRDAANEAASAASAVGGGTPRDPNAGPSRDNGVRQQLRDNAARRFGGR